MNTFRCIMLIIATVLAVPSALADETFRLSSFYEGNGIVRLEGKAAELNMAIPLASGIDVSKATLNLDLVSSMALVKERSILVVRFNNATIGQVLLSPNSPAFTATIDIPNELWREGFNSIAFDVSQHYTNQCEDGTAPELWSELNLFESSLDIEYERNIASLALDDLPSFFSPGIGSLDEVTLYSASDINDALLQEALPMTAQALALRHQYKPLTVNHSTIDSAIQQVDASILEGAKQQNTQFMDKSAWYTGKDKEMHVLVGTKASLSAHLPAQLDAQITGAFLGIQRTPRIFVDDKVVVPAQTRLIISGINEQDVITAARTLALMDDVLNPDPVTVVTSLPSETRRQADNAFAAPQILRPDNTYMLADLGATDVRLFGEGRTQNRVTFRLPADFYVPESAIVKLFLDFSYGAGYGPGSIMNINLNDEFIHGVALSDTNGQAFKNYQLSVSSSYLKPGFNTLDFNVNMLAPLSTEDCDEVTGDYLQFQLYQQSKIEIPAAGSVVNLPNLSLLSETAYPFHRLSSNMPTNVYLTDQRLYSSALTMVGKLAQSATVPLDNVSVYDELPSETSDNALVMATPYSLPDALNENFNASLQKTKTWPYRFQNELKNRVNPVSKIPIQLEPAIKNATDQQSSLGELGVLMADENPVSSHTGVMLLMVTETPEIMLQRVQDLIEFPIWNALAGDIVIWRDHESPELIMQIASRFVIGESEDRWLTLRMWLSNNPWIYLLGIIFLVAVLAFLGYLLLKRRNARIAKQW